MAILSQLLVAQNISANHIYEVEPSFPPIVSKSTRPPGNKMHVKCCMMLHTCRLIRKKHDPSDHLTTCGGSFNNKKHEDGEICKLYKVIQNVTVLSPSLEVTKTFKGSLNHPIGFKPCEFTLPPLSILSIADTPTVSIHSVPPVHRYAGRRRHQDMVIHDLDFDTM